MATAITLPFTCEYSIPEPEAPLHDVISRWSDSRVEKPGIIVVPSTEDDIVAAVRYAKEKGLRLLPQGGGHGTFLSIDAKTLCLDMKRFKTVSLDKEAGVVHVGGGALVGEVIKALSAEGYYSLFPNSNAIGMVGVVLGGGSTPMNGLHGFLLDNAVSFRLITAEGKILDLSESSTGEELALFHALCGAGHGLGVVTSMAVKAFPLKELQMTDDQIWVRRLIFPLPALDVAAKTFVQMQPPAAALSTTLFFVRAPPGSPVPGAPVIMLSGTYFGPAAAAEQAASALFDPAVVARAVKAETVTVPFARVNDAYEPVNRHGGHKGIASCFLAAARADAIVTGFERWRALTDARAADAAQTFVVYNGWNPGVMRERAGRGRRRFFGCRERGVAAFAFTWGTTPEAAEALAAFGEEFVSVGRAGEPEVSPRTFANNMRPGMDLGELHADEQIAELRRVKSFWDAAGVFWSPYGQDK